MKTKDVLLAAFLICGFTLLVKGLQVSATAEFWAWLVVAAEQLVASAAVKLLVLVLAVLWCASTVVLVAERSRVRRERHERLRKLEAAGEDRSRRVRIEIAEATAEPALPSNEHDRGAAA